MQARRGSRERIEARREHREIFPATSAKETSRETGQRSRMCKVLITYYPHYGVRRGSFVSLMSPLHPACIPSHCICITRDMNHPRIEEVLVLSRRIDPQEIYKPMMTLRVCDANRKIFLLLRC